MRRLLFILVAATVAGGVAYGAAAGLEIGNANLGAGNQDVESCDDSVEITYVLSETDIGMVAGLKLTDIDDGCNGAAVAYQLTLDGEEDPVMGTDELEVADGESAPIALEPEVDASAITGVAFTIAGGGGEGASEGGTEGGAEGGTEGGAEGGTDA